MTRVEQVLNEFIEAWNAGASPAVHDVLAQVPAGPEREELGELLQAWLAVAPAPRLDDAARERVRATPAVQAALAAMTDDGAWPVLLPHLRARRGLGLADLAARLAERFSLTGEQAGRTEDYLGRMERAELDPRGVSQRLLDAMADTLATSAEILREAAGGGSRPAGAALFRAQGEVDLDVHALADLAFQPSMETMDEVDRLFTGGADA
ncbi:MAG TPA: hypothetical protein VD931_22895 [Baekduia sp.]|nr:hypothetical protein [Baekduia sp.]